MQKLQVLAVCKIKNIFFLLAICIQDPNFRQLGGVFLLQMKMPQKYRPRTDKKITD
jgi:hypothetical protein